MPALCDEDKNRVRYHLNYVTGTTDAGVQAWLEEAMDTINSDFKIQRLQLLLNRCDAAENETFTGGTDTSDNNFALAARELYDGDIVRTRTQLREVPLKERWENYYAECDHLASRLNVPNLSRESAMIEFSHMYSGGSYIQAVPGPTDTCRSDKLYMKTYYR